MKVRNCNTSAPHQPHDWYPGWLEGRRACAGVPLEPWLRANPDTDYVFLPGNLKPWPMPAKKLEPHKHKLRMAYLTFPNDNPHSPFKKLNFICDIDECRYVLYSVERWKWEEMTGVAKEVDQGWPE